jgi:glycosyltransferase involved in cell wall biosynthesis
MRILNYVLSIDPSGGGVPEAVRQYCLAANRAGHTFDVITNQMPGEPSIADWPGRVIPAGPLQWGGWHYAPGAIPLLDEHVPRYDFVITHGIWRSNGLLTRNACLRHDVPYFVFLHGMLDPWFKHEYPRKHAVKWMFWPWSDYRVLRDARAALYTAEEEAELARQSFWLYRANPAITPLGIDRPPVGPDSTPEAFARAFPQLAGKRFIVFISRIQEKKGTDVLIEAFARIAADAPDLMLAIGGFDRWNWSGTLKALAERLGIASRIVWLGELEPALKWGALRSAEAFALSSHMENFGIVVAEAMSCGTPVLITKKINIWREIERDGAGIVGMDTVDSFTDVLRRWIALDAGHHRIMGERALACFESRYQSDVAYRSLVATLEKHRVPAHA